MNRVRGSPRYRVRVAKVGTEGGLIEALMGESFPDLARASIANKIASQYLHNPAGPAECLILEEVQSGEAAGMQSLVRRRFEMDGTEVQAAVMADFAVRASHRSLGPALQLLRSAVDQGRRAAGFLYGFPNKKAGPVFARAGLRPGIEMVRYAIPLRARHLVERRIGGRLSAVRTLAAALGDVVLAAGRLKRRLSRIRTLRWEDHTSVGPEFDEHWRGNSRAGLLVSDRSARMLRWRYPTEAAQRFTVARLTTGGPMIGYVVWSVLEGTIGIRDVFCLYPDRDLSALLSGFIGRVGRMPVESISMEFCGPSRLVEAVRRAGFVPRESSPVHVVVGEEVLPATVLAASLYLTSFDRDSD